MPRLLTFAAGLLLAGCSAAPAPSPVSSTVDGASLETVSVGGSPAYLQVLDLTKVRLDQVTGDHSGTAGPGAYYPGADSPSFQRIDTARMQRSCRDRYGAKAFSAVNAAFFEQYQPSTPLSFPVKVSGTVLTGGSSRYGPVPAPKSDYYRDGHAGRAVLGRPRRHDRPVPSRVRRPAHQRRTRRVRHVPVRRPPVVRPRPRPTQPVPARRRTRRDPPGDPHGDPREPRRRGANPGAAWRSR